jgi:predicted mannosyl-3-phosphoglycerate phosphatase (HAD superfamily)
VPRFLGKEQAVRHVLGRHVGPGPVLTLGVGDSHSDAPFLSLCDFALLPRGCQLGQHLLGGR